MMAICKAIFFFNLHVLLKPQIYSCTSQLGLSCWMDIIFVNKGQVHLSVKCLGCASPVISNINLVCQVGSYFQNLHIKSDLPPSSVHVSFNISVHVNIKRKIVLRFSLIHLLRARWLVQYDLVTILFINK